MTVTAVPSIGLKATLALGGTVQYAVKSLTPPGYDVAEVETTFLNQANAIQNFIPGLINSGSVTGSVYFDYNDTTQASMVALVGSTTTFAIVFPSTPTKTISGSCFLKKFQPAEIQPGEAMTADFELKCTGALTWA